jgi:eukaryotic-like serine/threonine-protein kinase
MLDAPGDDSGVAVATSLLSGRYRIVRPLGQGAIGRVYEVMHVEVGRRFAAKVLKTEHCDSPALRERFRKEAKLGGKLQSPYAVAVVDYGESAGTPFFVMEYLEGETLQALVAREGPLPVRRAATLLVQACRGVRAAHAFGVLHRDLKPSNLFVAEGERGELCKVLDFGIAKATDPSPVSSPGPETATGAVIGTLHYMPPEQLRGEPDLDERVDVYALGCILYECLSGKRAFEAPTPSALMYKILEEAAEPLEKRRLGLPGSLVACVQRAMAREREERTGSVEEFERELLVFTAERTETLASDATAPGTEVLAFERTRERWLAWFGRKGMPLAAAAALGGSVCAALGYSAGSNRGAPPRPPAATAGVPGARLRESESPAGPRQPESASAGAAVAKAPEAPAKVAGPATARKLSRGTPAPLPSHGPGSEPRAPGSAAPLSSAPNAPPAASSAEGSFDRQNPYRATP